MATQFTYSIQNDTLNGVVDGRTLHNEIINSNITIALDRVDTTDINIEIYFKANITSSEEAELNTIVSVHEGFAVNESELEIDSDKRQVVKFAATYKGWRYIAHPIEVETSKVNGLYSKDWTDNDRNDVILQFYKADGSELTKSQGETDSEFQIRLDSDCIKTLLTFSPSYDFDIVGGNVHQVVHPSTDVRLWVVAGATDVGAVTEFVGGLNMHFMGADEQITTDGRASARLNFTTPQVPVPTNKMQYIIRHGAGIRHKIMIVVEYFRA